MTAISPALLQRAEEFSQRVAAEVRVMIARDGTSPRSLRLLLGRSGPYLSARLSGEKPWAVHELVRLCQAYGESSVELIRRVERDLDDLFPRSSQKEGAGKTA